MVLALVLSADHDLEFKLKKVLEFLEEGYRVQLTVKHKREEEAAAAGVLCLHVLLTCNLVNVAASFLCRLLSGYCDE